MTTHSPSATGSTFQFRRFWGGIAVFAVVCSLCCGVSVWTQPATGQDLKGFKISADPLKSLATGRDPLADAAVKFTAEVSPKMAMPGDTVTLLLTLEMPRGMNTYSMSPSFGGGTKIKSEANVGVTAVGPFAADHPPEVEFEKLFKQDLEKFKGKVTWSRKFQIIPEAKEVRLKGILDFQVCDKGGCTPMKEKYDLTVELPGEPVATAPVPKRETDSVPAPPNPAPDNPTPEANPNDRFRFDATLRHKNAKAYIRLTPSNAKPGDIVTLEVHVDMAEGWHTYAISQPEGNAAQPTEIDVAEHVGLESIESDFQASKPFVVKEITEEKSTKKLIHQTYEHDITWTRKFRLAADMELSEVKVKGKFLFQVCNKSCISNTVRFELPRKSDAPPATPTRGSVEPTPMDTNVAAAKPGADGVTDLSDTDCVSQAGGDIREQGILHVLGVSFAFGWLALLTPCVFPMVPITVSFFLKQAEKRHNSPLKLALVYCFSIIGTFTVLGLLFSALFGATSINTLANGVLLNLFLGIVLMFFAMNLLGLFDIQIPSWLLTFTASKESASSYLGVFFMALTFTLTSFTCTFAFLGLILVWSASGSFWLPLGCLVAFSTAFAIPFFLLALFPSYLHRLPKSGGWMNRVKVVMGLIELAFMFKFLSVADISWNGAPTLFDYHLVMSAWMAISLVAGLYLIGKIQLPHDTREDYVGVIPVVMAIGFFTLSGYLAVGVFGQEPPGGFWGAQIAAFAPPRLNGGTGEDGPYLIGEDQQKYLLDFDRAKVSAQKSGRPLFIDFTGVNCINCRLMEDQVISNPAIQMQLQGAVLSQLFVDSMPRNAVADVTQSEALLQKNQALQERWFKNVTLPSYALVSPDGQTILSRIEGTTTTEEFGAFLQCGLNKWQRLNRPQVASK